MEGEAGKIKEKKEKKEGVMKKLIALMVVLAVFAMGAMPYTAMPDGHKKGRMGKGDKAGLEEKV